MNPLYDVIVGNVGTVYSGRSKAAAWAKYRAYLHDSKMGYGRAAGEDVTIMEDGEILDEHFGSQNTGSEEPEGWYVS